ncbi:ATP-binding protein, partial [Bacillus thuringiensis]|uniref:ATP-binding protein n=1 Tax=Bacillus thuringiensis TaxID=1428 RepID=UPI0020D286C6
NIPCIILLISFFLQFSSAQKTLQQNQLGYVPFQKQGAEILFHIIADCYEQKSVIVTSNLEFGQWNRIFGDNRLTSALVDRLVHHPHIIAFTGESYRLRNALSSGNTKINI